MFAILALPGLNLLGSERWIDPLVRNQSGQYGLAVF